MEINKKQKMLLSLGLALFINIWLCPKVFARQLIVGGQAVGIQAEINGVTVAELTEVETLSGSVSPAESAGLQKGDTINMLNGRQIHKACQLPDALRQLGGSKAILTVLRDGQTMEFTVQPVQSSEGEWKLGLWLRDSVSGIGTVTFCDPESGIYGALGHSINDADSGKSVQVEGGSISSAEVIGVTAGAPGAPGELNGCADLGKILGDIRKNTAHGIYGQYISPMSGSCLETGLITAGPAEMLCTVKGRQCSAYKVEINRIYKDESGEHVLLTVVDPQLLSHTGGIVQGMSGSPIVQNGKLVGAVTHVFVNDPAKGYGVSIQDMLRSAGIEERAA